MYYISSLVFVLFFLIGCGSSTTTSPKVSYDKMYEINETLNLFNPNRGFYKPVTSLDATTHSNRFQRATKRGFFLVYSAIKLFDYTKVATLPTSLLTTIKNNFEDAKNAHVKIILRIKYRDKGGEDPSTEIILGHLKQLAPLFQTYKDTIAVVEAGCIGAYGEWHSFTGDFVKTNPEYKANRKAIITSLEHIFPEKFILVRTPMHKELLFGSSQDYGDIAKDAQITSNIAFTQDIRAKVSHHNDCFLASYTDEGTYRSDNIKFWKDYVANDAKYAPLGGETCKDESTYTNCDNAQKELQKQGWSFVNVSYNQDVIQRWKDEGCYDNIAKDLGYKLRVDGLNYSINKKILHIELYITNDGYSSPFEKYDVSFLVHNAQHSYAFLQKDVDVRRWESKTQYSIVADINLTKVIHGDYTLSLKIAENNFAIRLVNKTMWNTKFKANELLFLSILGIIREKSKG